MTEHLYVQRRATERGGHAMHCPKCGSGKIALRLVNDLLRAVDLNGEIFEVQFQTPVWGCSSCKLCWQGQEAQAAKEATYQHALAQRLPGRIAA